MTLLFYLTFLLFYGPGFVQDVTFRDDRRIFLSVRDTILRLVRLHLPHSLKWVIN